MASSSPSSKLHTRSRQGERESLTGSVDLMKLKIKPNRYFVTYLYMFLFRGSHKDNLRDLHIFGNSTPERAASPNHLLCVVI